MGVGDINFRKAVAERPEMGHWGTTVHHDYQGALAADEVD